MKKLIYGKYYVTESGDVYNNNTGHKLKPQPSDNGYLKVGLRIDGKTKNKFIHRLVYEYFVGEIPKGFEINHKNHNRIDNNLYNLELVDRKGNMQHSVNAGRIAQKGRGVKKPVINIDTNEWFPSATQASVSMGLNKWAVHQALTRKHKTCGGYRWRYA